MNCPVARAATRSSFALVVTEEGQLYAFDDHKRGQRGQGLGSPSPYLRTHEPITARSVQQLRIAQTAVCATTTHHLNGLVAVS